MTHVYERLYLNCPYTRAREYLRAELEDTADFKTMQFAAFGLLVRYRRGRDPLHFDEPWEVYWTPEDGGPFPDFSGEIAVRAEGKHFGVMLEISGDYSPPFGAAGRVFDMAEGAKFASAASRALLRHLAERVEARFRTEAAVMPA